MSLLVNATGHQPVLGRFVDRLIGYELPVGRVVGQQVLRAAVLRRRRGDQAMGAGVAAVDVVGAGGAGVRGFVAAAGRVVGHQRASGALTEPVVGRGGHGRHAVGLDVEVADPVSVATGPDDMWVTGDRIAEIQTLSVGPGARSTGIGTLLLDSIDSELHARGVRDVQIAVVASNADALRLYQRRGFTPRLVVLSNYAHEL